MTADKVFENKLRRVAERQGFRLEKSRRKDPRAVDYGGYMLVDAGTNTVVIGAEAHAYSANIEDIAAHLGEPMPKAAATKRRR